MNRNSHEWSHLVAQAHGLYLRLRDRAHDRTGQVASESIPLELVEQAYQRYQRRVMGRH
jgi:hypothetical protein